MHFNVTLFNREQCYRKYMKNNTNEPDEHVFFDSSVITIFTNMTSEIGKTGKKKVRQKIFEIEKVLKLSFFNSQLVRLSLSVRPFVHMLIFFYIL